MEVISPQPNRISPTTRMIPPKVLLNDEPVITERPVTTKDAEAEDFLKKPLEPKYWPNISHIVTEDDTPVDNIFSEKQQRLLTESLYTSWQGPGEERSFLTFANVGLFYAVSEPPLVPDVLVSLDVQIPDDIWTKHHRAYFAWQYGKVPDIVIEIVSNKKGQELDQKLRDYARLKVPYYVVFNPHEQLTDDKLHLYELRGIQYIERQEKWLSDIKLGLTLWQGVYEDKEDTWLRWRDKEGHLMLTGAERSKLEHQRAEQERQRAEQERQRAEQERQRAEQERQRAEQERQRAEQEHQEKQQALSKMEHLAAKLRELGIDPEKV